MRKVLSITLLMVALITLVACGNNDQAFDLESETIVVGLEADYKPYNWSETEASDYNHPISGEDNLFAAGYDVEIAKIIAQELGMNLEIKMITWTALVPALNSNKIDLIIAGMSPTEDRKEQISFTEPYTLVNHVIVASATSDIASMESLEELSGLSGVGQIGTIYADLVTFTVENFSAEELPAMDTVPEIARAIETGVADFTIVEKPVADGLIGQNDNLVIAYEPNKEDNVFELSAADREISIGVRQIDDVLTSRLNEILSTITEAQRDALMAEAILKAA